MNSTLTRRDFVRTLMSAAAGLCLQPAMARPAGSDPFSFLYLGDLHFDKLPHHDLDWLQKEKPDDARQVRDYSRITADILPGLFTTLRDVVGDANGSPDARIAFALQVGDLVEGLCGSEQRALRQNTDAIEFLQGAKLGVPFVFTKGNHDITGEGAAAAFKSVFHPFLAKEIARINRDASIAGACSAVVQGEALFCFYDAYDKESLPWLEATLAKRTARHCFVVLHPPVVPYGARAAWHIFSSQREQAQRARLLELLGKNNVFVLSGHIHKYNMLVRATPNGGRFLQLGLGSVISAPNIEPHQRLSGIGSYNPDQVTVEPAFSPATEKQRRAVYETEAAFVQQFEYADAPGYGVVTVRGSRVTARLYAGTGRHLWRTLEFTDLLEGKNA